MRRFVLLVLVASLALSAVAQKKKKVKQELPDQVLAAQFVYVVGWHGDLFDARVPMEERNAINRVQSAVAEWGRYKLANRPEDADIMFVVKATKNGMVQGGGGIGGPDIGAGTPQPGIHIGNMGTGPGYGAEMGNVSDSLMVSIFPKDDPQSAPFVWRRSQDRAFQGRGKLPLLEEFKKSVTESEKAKAANAIP